MHISFPLARYTLSDETKQSLKTPGFDVWQWEPNEMLSLLEEMFYDLGLVEELNIYPSTLKRFLEIKSEGEVLICSDSC